MNMLLPTSPFMNQFVIGLSSAGSTFRCTFSSPGNILLVADSTYQSRSLVLASSSPSVFVPGDDRPSDSTTRQWRKKIAGVDQGELVDPFLLADSDSRFCEFGGVTIHHKIYDCNAESFPIASSSTKCCFPFILLHGFGASVFSWNSVVKPLSELTSSKVVAFDRPAFGLTSRSDWRTAAHLNPYSMEYSVFTTLYFIDSLTAEKAVLIGHSAGCMVAVNTYFEAPQRVAALVLIAPAILAPNGSRKVVAGASSESESHVKGNTVQKKGFSTLVLNGLSRCVEYIARVIIATVKGIRDFIISVSQRVIVFILSSAFGVMLIRVVIDKFGVAAVRSAWHDANKVTQKVIHGYTKPLRVKGWDKALVDFVAAMVNYTDFKNRPSLSDRLHQISCPVLIITGENDRLVPLWNSKRLSQVIPGSCFEVIKQCGHLPHEEKAEEFISAVDKFLQRNFSSSAETS